MDIEASSSVEEAESLSRDELKTRLEAIAEKDASLAVLFAGRCALRVITFLASSRSYSSIFGCWGEADQARHLLAVWFAGTLGFVHSDKLYLYRASAARVSASASDAAAYSAANSQDYDYTRIPPLEVYAFDAAERAAAYAAASAAASADAQFVEAAAYATDAYAANATRIAAGERPSARVAAARTAVALFSINIKQDLTTLEGEAPHQLFTTPLWNEQPDESKYSQQLLHWLRAVPSLANKVEHPRTRLAVKLLAKIPIAYKAILNGRYSRDDATDLAAALLDYFEGLESSEEKPESIPRPQVYDYNPSLTQSTEQPSGVDHLGRENLYNALAAILASPSNKGHQTIGLLGEWGAGKSSWIKALENALKSQASTQPFLVSTFNAWSYESVPNLQAGIAHELIKTLVEPPARKEGLWKPTWNLKFWLSFLKRDIKDVGLALWRFKWPEFFDWVSDNPRKLWWNIRLKSYVAIAMHGGWKMFWLLMSFLFAVVPFAAMLYWMPNESADDEHILAVWLAKSAGLFATLLLIYKSCAEQIKTLWAAPRAQELLTYLRLPSYAKHLGEIPEMRKTLEKFCDVRLTQMTENNIEGGHTRLLVVVDDLDRCSHQQIVKVFEAVRLVLEIDHVTVIIAVDQHIALAALALHYKDLAAHHKLANPRAIARDYLAKVIHLPITLSHPELPEVTKLLEYIWETTEPPLVEAPDTNPPSPQPLDTSAQEPVERNDVAQSISENTNPPVEPTTENSSQLEQERATENNDIKTKKSTPPEAEVVKVIGLSKDQKAAFIHWAKHFGLHNPRQLKRLNNTYSLMLNAHKHHDKTQLFVDSDFGRQHQKASFAVLVTLMAIEYLNSLDNSGLRKKLKAHLQGNAAAPLPNEAPSKSVHPINPDFIAFFKALNESAKMNLFKAVESFVLPAIESDEDEHSCQQTL